MDISAIVWFVLIIVFLYLESTTVSLVSLWFAAGALAGLIASFCNATFWVELAIFVGVSVLMLAALRPVLKKYINPKLEKTNVDALVGTTGRVLEQIDNLRETGRVKLGGIEWTARSTDGSKLPEGTIVKVDRIVGVKAYVSAEKTDI